MAEAAAGALAAQGEAIPAAQALLSVRNLGVTIDTDDGQLTAIDGVSFEIARGEVLGIVGESGAGKSLTGMAVAGLLEPPIRRSAGEINLDGQRIDSLPPEAMRKVRGRRIGLIFQDPMTALNPVFSIGHHLVETIREHADISRAEARAHAIGLLTDVGIPAPESRLESYPHEFSGGMRQRVVIALALAGNPELVIADEPTTALDVSIQAQIIALIQRLCAERGVAVILVTHDIGVIAEAADKVAVMYAGRIVEAGPVREVLLAPKHPYTVGLIGSIPEIGRGLDRLPQIPGAAPRLSAMPTGCAFHPRCPRRFAPCDAEVPAVRTVGESRVACHLYEPDQA